MIRVNLKMGLVVIGIAALLAAGITAYAAATYNSLVAQQMSVQELWSKVISKYQLRAEVLGRLVNEQMAINKTGLNKISLNDLDYRELNQAPLTQDDIYRVELKQARIRKAINILTAYSASSQSSPKQLPQRLAYMKQINKELDTLKHRYSCEVERYNANLSNTLYGLYEHFQYLQRRSVYTNRIVMCRGIGKIYVPRYQCPS